jgi:tetratricopeptide (TPR) repeat protein
MEFSQNNSIVRTCLQGIAMEKQGNPEEASRLFLQAWNEAEYNFEKFISAYFVARHQRDASDRLVWLKTALQIALGMNDSSVQSAFPLLYSNIAKCYEEMGDVENAKKNHELATSFNDEPSDKGPFFHGTKADLKIGDLLTAGGRSNYKEGLNMNHIYFTALVNGAGLAASLAKGDGHGHVYIVEPTGKFENDPNVTNSYFPGNQTRSYRSQAPLKVVGEVTDWEKLTQEELEAWQKKLKDNEGEIIN